MGELNQKHLDQIFGLMAGMLQSDGIVHSIDEDVKHQFEQRLQQYFYAEYTFPFTSIENGENISDNALIYSLFLMYVRLLGDEPEKNQVLLWRILQTELQNQKLKEEIRYLKATLEKFNGREAEIEQLRNGKKPAKKDDIDAATVYWMYKMEKKSLRKIADELGVSPSLVCRRLKEAEQKLKKQIDEWF